MIDHIQPGVKRLLDSPEDRQGVTLIVGVEDSSSDQIIDAIERTGATVEESLFYDNLAVSINESTELRELCTLDTVTSVEIEGVWEPMDEGGMGNSHTLGTLLK